jgi:hypothetical protein
MRTPNAACALVFLAACSSAGSEPSASLDDGRAGASFADASGSGGTPSTPAKPEAGRPDAARGGAAGATEADASPPPGEAGPPRTGASSFAVFEKDFTAPSTGYANPWENVTVSMTVTSPTGKTTTVGGFFYTGATYKARFRPDEAGTWAYAATITDTKGGSTTDQGTFAATPDGHGFIRQSPDNPARFSWEDGTPYYGLGLQGGMPSAGGIDQAGGVWGGPNLGGQSVDLDTFLKTTGASGINMLRWTLDNGTPGLFSTIAPLGNVYKEQEGQDGDRIVAMARQYGFAVLFTFFNYWQNKPPYFDAASISADQSKALQRYEQYLVDRYGAYIDIWEVVNEGNASAAWYAATVPYLKTHDPYGHDVSTSTVYDLGEAEYASGVTLNMMHWYAPVTEDVAAAWTFNNLQDWKAKGETGGVGTRVIVGETGNCCSVCNYGPTGFRLRNWAAFFAEGILVYWDASGSKGACGGGNTNYYIGDEERGFAKVLSEWNQDFDPKAEVDLGVATDRANVSAYALAGPASYGAYVVADDHKSPTTGVKLTAAPLSGGHATWTSPSTGALLGELDVPAGSQTLDVPTFTTDIALKIQRP